MKKRRNFNKKGVQLTLETVLLLILAVMAVVMLSLYFTGSFKGLFEKIETFYSKTNVDEVIKSCNLLADSGSDYSFCCDEKKVKYYEISEGEEDAKRKLVTENLKCKDLIKKEFAKGKIKEVNCRGILC